MLRLATLGVFVLVFAVACGGEKDKEQAQAEKPCGAFVGMMAGKPRLLPKGFPTPTDAEVNFSGGNTTGQVKLVQACKGRTSVTITARPA